MRRTLRGLMSAPTVPFSEYARNESPMGAFSAFEMEQTFEPSDRAALASDWDQVQSDLGAHAHDRGQPEGGFLSQSKSGLISAPLAPHAWQTNDSSRSDTRIWSGHRSPVILA